MTKLILLAAACLAGAGGATVQATPTAGALQVNVAGIRSNNGRVVVTLCLPNEAFPGGCHAKAQSAARKGLTRLTFPGIAAGTYAVAVFHDEDGDGKLTFMKEGIGFSNDSNLAFGQPKFAPASFKVRGATAILLNIKYFG